jgi:poly(A) polymerase/tRNA nucleotidyltransferase (CCA-adding enzyme)
MLTKAEIKLSSEAEFIIARLKREGHEAYVVGGVVRDWLLKKQLTDWDFTTSASASEIKRIFKDRLIFSLKHDTVTVVIKGKNYEITPFRGKDLIEDLMHRDFTINALAYDSERCLIIDPYGGIKDLKRKLVKATVDPKARFSEDPLRLMRAIRFAVELNFRIHKDTLNTISEMAELIQQVSWERIRDELVKILVSSSPARGIEMMHKLGLLKYVIPELSQCYGVRQNRFHKYTVFKHIMMTLQNTDPDPVLRLSALFHDIGKPLTKSKKKGRVTFYQHEKKGAYMTRQIMKRLKFSNEMIYKVEVLVREHMLNYSPEWSDSAVRRLISRVGKDLVIPLIMLRKADLIAHGKDKSYEIDLLEELRRRVEAELGKGTVLTVKDLSIDGHVIMKELGIPQGPEVGRILKMLWEKVIEDPRLNKPELLLSLAKKIKRQERIN